MKRRTLLKQNYAYDFGNIFNDLFQSYLRDMNEEKFNMLWLFCSNLLLNDMIDADTGLRIIKRIGRIKAEAYPRRRKAG